MWDSILAYMWEAGLKAFREVLDKQDKKSIPTEDSVKMTEFVLKNNFYEFKIKIKQQVSGTAISTKFTPPYACLLSLRKVFLKRNNCDLQYDSDAKMIFSLYGRMVRKNFTFFWKALMNLIPVF